MNFRLTSVLSILSVFVLVFGFVVRANAATELLPNLTPLNAHDLMVQQIGRKKYLRFSTTSWNNGAGPLEIRGGETDRQAKRQKVYQRIFSDDGSFRDVLAGSFVWHKAHGHIHFDDYAIYTVQAVTAPGASDTQSAKTTFCIMDTTPVNIAVPNSTPAPAYNTCNTQVQGMSVGWGDTYPYDLPGQSVEITKLPDGEYDLKIEVDPRGHIEESNETDNISTLRIQISGNNITTL